MSTPMKASIIVATYNRLPKLKRCLRRLEKQEFEGLYEIIIVDDGSADGTWDFLQKRAKVVRKLRVFSQKNQGPAVARNRAIRAAKGMYIFFTDDDVLMPKDWLAKFSAMLDAHPRVAAVGGVQRPSLAVIRKNVFARFEDYMSRKAYVLPETLTIGGFETYGCVTNNAAYRRSVLLKTGLFDESFPVPGGEDADLKLRVVRAGHKLAFFPVIGEHIQDYSFNGFWRQQVTRGTGVVFFERKWKSKLTVEQRQEAELGRCYSLPWYMLRRLHWRMLTLFLVSVIASRIGQSRARRMLS